MDAVMNDTSGGNATNNTSGVPSTPGLDTVNFGALPGFIVYNVIMLVFILVPVTIVDILLLVAMFFDKITPIQIKTVIANLTMGALFVAFALALEHLSALVLGTADYPVPPRDFCHFIVWTIAGGGAARILFTAVFSVTVYIVVKSSANAINQKALVACCVGLWLLAFFVSAPLLSAVVIGSQFLGKTACAPRNTEVSSAFGYLIYIPVWVIICGIFPFILTIGGPIFTLRYLNREKVLGDVEFKKAIAKMSFFLVIGIVFNLVGQAMPPVLFAILFRNGQHVNDPLVIYVAFTLMNLSLIPTPILIVVYLRGIRSALKELLLCYRVRGKHSKKGRTYSKSDSVSSSTRKNTADGRLPRQNTGISDVSAFSRQNTGLSETSMLRQNSEITEAKISNIKSGNTLGVITESEEHETVSGIVASRSHHSGMNAERLQNEEIIINTETSDSGCVDVLVPE